MSSKDIESSEDAKRAGLRAISRTNPTLYIVVLVVVMVAAFAAQTRRDTIFACPANAYGDDYYLGYCQADSYGDYDHGAVWFGLEPRVRAAAAAADVLFLGSSRLQYGLSSAALERWFAMAGARYYLLGFSHTENIGFLTPLLRDLKPRARAYVVNLDKTFYDKLNGPARAVMHEPDARARYRTKRAWQAPHRLICGWLPALCGDAVSIYRARGTGAWRLAGSEGLAATGIGADLPVDRKRVAIQQAAGEKFLAGLGVDRRCVLLTYLPHQHNQRATAAALAATLGFDLISPEVADLHTFDGSHLDRESAERFAGAFLKIAGPRLRACLAAKP